MLAIVYCLIGEYWMAGTAIGVLALGFGTWSLVRVIRAYRRDRARLAP
jgi:hypothetical protein